MERTKTVAEQLFESYLAERGFKDYQHEPDIEGTAKHPDYRVLINEAEAYFEVKEFEPPIETPSGGSFDPYPAIREKINDAQKQLRSLKGRRCAVVLSNPHNAFVFLDSTIIYGAMLGNVGITMPFDPKTGVCDDSQMAQTFLQGGKMIRYRNGVPIAVQNTTISAVCVLGRFTEASRRMRIRIVQDRRNTGKACTPTDIWDMVTSADDAIMQEHIRMRVYENPYAVAPFTDAFATGPYDEWFGIREGCLRRISVGPALEALEADELEVGIERKNTFF